MDIKMTPENRKKIYYIRGILRNRLSEHNAAFWDEGKALRYISNAFLLGASLDEMEKQAKQAINWSTFFNPIRSALGDDLYGVVGQISGEIPSDQSIDAIPSVFTRVELFKKLSKQLESPGWVTDEFIPVSRGELEKLTDEIFFTLWEYHYPGKLSPSYKLNTIGLRSPESYLYITYDRNRFSISEIHDSLRALGLVL